MSKYFYFLILFFYLLNAYSQNIIHADSPDEQSKFIFDSLKNKLGNKRIVCLGESEHRIETFSRFKSEFIKYLHENSGFDVVAFESSIMNVANGYYNFDSDSAALKESLYGIWQTESVLDLFKYSKKKNNSQPSMILAGFDIKSGLSYSPSLWLKNIIKSINNKYADTVFTTDTMLISRCASFENKLEFIPKSKSEIFKTFYSSLIDTLNLHRTFLIKQNVLDENQFKIIKQSVLNRKYLAEFLSSKNMIEAAHYRDSVMTINILWLVNDLYKDKKIILWAHDYHISKKTVKDYKRFDCRSSIEMLPLDTRDQIETISLNFIKRAPRKLRKKMKSMYGNEFLIMQPNYLNGEFEDVIYFKETKGIKNYSLN